MSAPTTTPMKQRFRHEWRLLGGFVRTRSWQRERQTHPRGNRAPGPRLRPVRRDPEPPRRWWNDPTNSWTAWMLAGLVLCGFLVVLAER